MTRSAETDRPTLPREFGRACLRMALPLVLVLGGMLLLGLLITHVLAHGVLAHEVGANRTLAAHRTHTLNLATHVTTYLAETPTIIGLTAAGAVICRLVFRRWREAVFLVLCVAGETVIFLITSWVIDRKRPPVTHLDDAPPTSSFPSGHTAAAVCFYGAVAAILLWHHRHPALRAAAVTLAVLVPPLVAVSRIYRGMHWPSDVVSGLLLGLVWLALSTRLLLTHAPPYGLWRRSLRRRSMRAGPMTTGAYR
jgi:membrane-associated phospholipid phosphatase